jgi:enoyl-CoA hydratase/carnithine racemase
MNDSVKTDDSPLLTQTLVTASGHAIGIATLNAPKSLNSLTLPMVDLLDQQLRAWQADKNIVCVVLRGSGDKAFCAGGDVVALHNSAVSGDDYAATFFEREYRIDYLIHTYQKPIIVWGHGIVMGGGMGLLAGASHRVVTAQTRLAMPEVTIGLYPDVGGSFFLNRAPGRTGLFLALTGASINASDTLFLGMADRFLDHAQFDAVLAALQTQPWNDSNPHKQVSTVLRQFEAQAAARPANVVRDHYDYIQKITDGDVIDDIVASITAYAGDDDWLRKGAQTLKSGCPVTIHIIDQQLKRGRQLSLKEVFQMELIISVNCTRFKSFPEGVRALLIDKDKNPKFEPATLQGVTRELIEQHFTAPWGGKLNPLDDLK